MNNPSASFQRVCKLLNYIHSNIEQSLSLEELAEQSCWSRWQLQRVFQYETGLSVACYVREIKLSHAAEVLLTRTDRVIDIGLGLGFGSEISFSRAFKQHFGISPRAYRKQGQLFGVRKPLIPKFSSCSLSATSQLIEVKVESYPSFNCYGVTGKIRGILSSQPDFSYQVPQIWQKLYATFPEVAQYPLVGVIDVTSAHSDGSNLRYLAGSIEQTGVTEVMTVPFQTYAVIKHKGPVSGLAKTLEWFIFHWLPESDYRGVDGYELEHYPQGYQPEASDSEMEYWLPVSPA